MLQRYTDRREAGEALARALPELEGRSDVLVLALPRGGIEVAAGLARRLKVPLDVLVVRRLALLRQPEFSLGAVATGGAKVLHDRMIRRAGINRQQLDAVVEREQAEVEQAEQHFRGDRPCPDVTGKTLVLVADGLDSGTSMRAAIETLRDTGASQLLVAVPVAPPELHHVFEALADRYLVTLEPAEFSAVAEWYVENDLADDAGLREMLDELAPSGRPS